MEKFWVVEDNTYLTQKFPSLEAAKKAAESLAGNSERVMVILEAVNTCSISRIPRIIWE